MKKFIFLTCALIALVGSLLIFGSHEALGSTIAISPILANMSREELEGFTEQLFSDNYGGDSDYDGFDDLDDDDVYDGFDDDLVSFMGGARSFLDEANAGIYLTFTIVNNSGYSKTVCINPAYFDCTGLTVLGSRGSSITDVFLHHHDITEIAAAGHNEIEAVIAEGLIYGTSGAGITCTSTNGRITDHLRFMLENPVRIPQMVLASVKNSTGAVDTTIYSKIMTLRKANPYTKFQDTLIDLNDFFKVEQYQSGKITVDTAKYGAQVDNQTLIFLQIDNDIRLTVKMLIGGSANSSRTLHQKAKKAKRNVAQGTAGVVPVGVRKNMKLNKAKKLNLLTKAAFPVKK